MPVTVVVDGFYGSSGKGKCVVQLCRDDPSVGAAVRCGGPNAGHTVYFGQQSMVMRQIPSAVASRNPRLYYVIAAGSIVDPELLWKEIYQLDSLDINIRPSLKIDPMAAVVDIGAAKERSVNLGDRIGSTQTGTGWTASKRAMRDATLARDVPDLVSFITDTVELLNEIHDSGKRIIVEGTQGLGLSLFCVPHYPWCTSKDTAASTFLAECGLSPRTCDRIYAVYRSYPIRVGGNSGPMYKEIDWQTVHERAGFPANMPLIELTSVTRKIRRVGEWDWELFKRSIRVNRPTNLVLHGADYISYANRSVRQHNQLDDKTVEHIARMEVMAGAPVTMIFTGPHQDDLIVSNYINLVSQELKYDPEPESKYDPEPESD